MPFYDSLSHFLGLSLEAKDLTFSQVSLRGIIVFVATLVMVRSADKRFLARINPLDAILGFILASMLARAINGSAPFFPTLGGGFVLIFFHRFIAYLAFRWERFGNLVKGKEDVLLDQGYLHAKSMRKNHITKKDLMEELRLNGNLESLAKVKRAVIERSGEISVVKRET